MHRRAKPSETKEQLVSEIYHHPEADNVTPEAVSRLLKMIDNAPPQREATRRHDDPRTATTRAIMREMDGLDIGKGNVSIVYMPIGSNTTVLVDNIRLLRLPRELAWTSNLRKMEQAKNSAVQAIMRLAADLQAVRCSYEAESPVIEQALFCIRSGLCTADDPIIATLTEYALATGKGRQIPRRIADAMDEAERRKNNGTPLPDLNEFRLTLATAWIGCLFWQMSEENIAKFMSDNGLLPAGFKRSRRTVNQAIKDLRLVKGPDRVVKAVGPNFNWVFREGYHPPQ